jgi:hypothetical protein
VNPEEVVGFIDDAVVEKGYRMCCDGAMGVTQIIVALELERKGGPCPVCGRGYIAVEVDNRFARFTYYKPSCRCFRVCGRCGRIMVSERLLGLSYCTACGMGKPREVVKRSERKSIRDGKAAASGERMEV